MVAQPINSVMVKSNSIGGRGIWKRGRILNEIHWFELQRGHEIKKKKIN